MKNKEEKLLLEKAFGVIESSDIKVDPNGVFGPEKQLNDLKRFNIHVLPETPIIEDLFKFSSIRLRKMRMVKKFCRHYYRYIPHNVYIEFLSKRMVIPIRRALNFNSIGRKIISVEAL